MVSKHPSIFNNCDQKVKPTSQFRLCKVILERPECRKLVNIYIVLDERLHETFNHIVTNQCNLINSMKNKISILYMANALAVSPAL